MDVVVVSEKGCVDVNKLSDMYRVCARGDGWNTYEYADVAMAMEIVQKSANAVVVIAKDVDRYDKDVERLRLQCVKVAVMAVARSGDSDGVRGCDNKLATADGVHPVINH